ncbi:unnamed protein product [Eretmochelys imbricata]
MSPASREQFQTEQEADESLQRAWTAARSNPPPLSSSNRSRFVVERGLLYKETLSGGHQEDWHPQRQLVVPTKYRAKLLSLAHDHPSGHAGVNRTKDRLGGSFHWEGMGKDVSTYVQSCEVCQRVGKPQDQVGQGTISPLQAKVDAIQKWPVPKSKKQVQSFLGLAGYYRRFVPHYSQIAAPLTDLTKKKQPNAVQWTGKCQKAFNKLKATLMSDPVLRAPDFDKPFLVTTDASERGVGAVLMQKGPDQEFHPVVFLSKKLSERESNWSVTEKECYAIVYALEKLRPYVWGRRFHLQTDHAALKWLHTVKETNKKLLRWSLALQDFDFDIQHISGASNKVADALSRESFPESTG